MSETRKLAAILVADVVGYSRLAGADEDRTLARLRGLRSDLIDPAITAHHGRIVKRTGDGSIIEFRSVVDAVRCAIEVQQGLIERNAGVPPERRIEFRVGIHVGDVVEEADGDLMGDGVNVAARVEGVAKPGAICLSEQAYWQVKGRLELNVTDLGATRLKNIAEPIHVYSLEVGQPAQAKPAPSAPENFAPARLSLVVLPFANIGGDPEQAYFVDGVTESLTTDLSRISGAFVIGRSTAFTYKGKAVDLKQIGRDLNVRYVLEGSVQRGGGRMRVNVQLIEGETGAHVWAERFDKRVVDLFEMQDEIVSRLANCLGVELVKAEAQRAIHERPNNPDALDLAMQGWASINNGFNKTNYDAAIGWFERALQLHPELTWTQVGLAWGLVDRAFSFRGGNEAEDLPRAEALITRALSAEPNSAWAHFVKADLLTYGKKQFGEALSELEVAIDNDRNFARAYALRAAALIFNGEAERAIPEAETALRLSPRDPLRNWWEFRIGHAHAHMAQWEKVVEWTQRSIATSAGHWLPYVDLAAACGWLGRGTEAKWAIDGLHKLMPGFTAQDFANMKWSGNPKFQREYARIVEGLRKAGVPEV